MTSIWRRCDRTGGNLLLLYGLLVTVALPPVLGLIKLAVDGTLPGDFVVEIWLMTMITLLVLILVLTSNMIAQKLQWFLNRRQTQGGAD